jgi:hypothetical protein
MNDHSTKQENNRKCHKNTSFLDVTCRVDLDGDRVWTLIENQLHNLRMPIGGGGILIPGGKPRPAGAIWLKPGPPIPRTGPCRPGAAKPGAPGTGGMIPTNNDSHHVHVEGRTKSNEPRPAARPAP